MVDVPTPTAGCCGAFESHGNANLNQSPVCGSIASASDFDIPVVPAVGSLHQDVSAVVDLDSYNGQPLCQIGEPKSAQI